MPDLSQTIRSIQQEAAVHTTPGLRDQIMEDIAELDELIGQLDRLSARRGSTADGEMDYVDLVGDIMAIVLYLAISVKELTTRPVAWTATLSPN